MYLHLGRNVVIRQDSIIGIFDMDNASSSHITREYLYSPENKKRIVSISDELPKSFVVTSDVIYLSQLSSQTLQKRALNPYAFM